MVYCYPLACKFLSQVTYNQLQMETDSDYEAFIQELLIPAAEEVIDNFCNHDFNSNSGTITLDGNGKNRLMIPPPYVPVTAVSTVTIDGSAVTIGDIKVYDTFIAYDGGTFTEDFQNVSVVLSYGYSSVPASVEFACAQLVANYLIELVRRKMLPSEIARELGRERGSIRALYGSPRVFTDEIKEILNAYRYSSIGTT